VVPGGQRSVPLRHPFDQPVTTRVWSGLARRRRQWSPDRGHRAV